MDLAELKRAWEKAKRRWNNDNGPIEKTVAAGEDLYFAAQFLIDELTDQLAKPEVGNG